MELSNTDKKLLYALDFHSRIPLSILSRKLGISKQRAAYRLEHLEKTGIIQGYYVDTNPAALGLVIYLLYFKFQHMSNEQEQAFIRHLNKESRISVNVSVQGKWDHSVAIFARDVLEFKVVYERVMMEYEKFVKEKLITIVTDFWYFKPRYLVEREKKRELLEMSGPAKKVDIDGKDDLLLKILSANARMSLVEIGRKINLSPNAVKVRLKRLEKQGVILGYRVMINHEKMRKLQYRVFFFLENASKRQDELRSFLAGQPEVVSITKTIGHAEIESRVIVDDVNAFYEFMTRIKSKFSDVLKDFEPIIYYRFHKSLDYYPVE